MVSEVTTPVLERLGLSELNSGACGREWVASPGGPELSSYNPANGQELARVQLASESDYERVVTESVEVFQQWRMLPRPARPDRARDRR